MNEILPILKQLFAAYPNTPANEGAIVVYVRLLKDIPADQLQAVIDQCIVECKFLPTVAEIHERYHTITRKLGELTAAEAWGRVVKAFGSHGRMHSAKDIFAGTTLRAVEAMGWRTLCDSEDQMADRAHFLRIYEQLASREDQMHKLLPQARAMLPDNVRSEPRKIGDVLEDMRRRNGVME